MLPLIPGDFVSSDGSRLIRSLTTREQLFSHGFTLGNCLSKGYAFVYLHKGSGGTTFIVGVFENGTEKPLSTAEIAVKRYPEILTYDLVVRQHTAKLNSQPSASCTLAIEELMTYCRTPDIRRRLEHAWQLIRHGARLYRRDGKIEIDSTMRTALMRTLGDDVYECLFARILDLSVPGAGNRLRHLS